MEEWLKSRPRRVSWIASRSRVVPGSRMRSRVFGKPNTYYGKPIQLFKDSDRDGVPNVFDCKPYNRRKTDVIPPLGGGIMEMYSRQEQARQSREYQKEYARQLKEAQRLEEERQKQQAENLKKLFADQPSPTYGFEEKTVAVYNPNTGRTEWVSIYSKEAKAASQPVQLPPPKINIIQPSKTTTVVKRGIPTETAKTVVKTAKTVVTPFGSITNKIANWITGKK